MRGQGPLEHADIFTYTHSTYIVSSVIELPVKSNVAISSALTDGMEVRPQEFKFRKRSSCRPARSMGNGCGPGSMGAAAGVVTPLKESPRYKLPSTSRVVSEVSCPSTGGSEDSVQKSRFSTCRHSVMQVHVTL